jgi:hypothetical protein
MDDVSRLTGQGTMTGGRVHGRYMDHSMLDKWQCLIGWRGATWPSHGLLRGTLWLALQRSVKFYGLHRSQTPDLFQATDWQDWANHLLH